MDRSVTGLANILTKIFLDSSGGIRSGWKILIFLELIALFARTFLAKVLSWFPFDMDTVVVTLLISLFMIRYFDRKPLRTLGVFPEKGWKIHFLYGVIFAGGTNLLIFLCLWSLGFLSWQWNPQFYLFGALGFVSGFMVYVFGSTFQELLFRGYLFHRLVESTGKIAAVLITSIAFALYHTTGGTIGWINLGILGIILGVSVLRSGTLWFAIGMHIGWNIFEGLIFSMIVSGGGGYSSLLSTQVQGSEMLTGGRFGPEGSVLEIPILLAILIWCFRSKVFAAYKAERPAFESRGLKPAWAMALAMLSVVGPIYYCSVHVPTMADLPAADQVHLPIVLYQKSAESINEVRSLKLHGFEIGADNRLEAIVAVDTTRFDRLEFNLTSSSHGLVKRHVISQEHTEEAPYSPKVLNLDAPSFGRGGKVLLAKGKQIGYRMLNDRWAGTYLDIWEAYDANKTDESRSL